MARRQRSGEVTTAVPRQYSRLVYEDFQPISERKEEAAENIIIIHLPGFTKERIKVAYVNCSRTVTARGERPVVNDRWSRFNQSFPVPENCNTDKIRAKFQHGALSITIPKKIVATVGPAEKSVSQSKNTQKVQEEIIPTSMPASTSGVEKRRRPEEIAQPRSLKRVATERKVEKGREDIPPKATSSSAIDERKWVVKTNQSRSPPEATTDPNAQKGQEYLAPPKATAPTSDTRNVTGKASMASSAVKVDRQKSIGKKDDDRNRKAKETEESDQKYAEKKMVINGKESGEKSTDSFVKHEISSTAPKISENRDQEKKVRSSGGKVEEEMIGKEADLKAEKGIVRIKTVMDSAKQRVNSLAKRMKNEDKRQSLVNIGAAVLVILALGVGAYLSYSYRSRSGI
ncbi:inactive protein RESTRICTED TEV MOVEMENT 2 [Juglans microcarpa x Juglans regia]|uniref:inactive protein RESTRICTED TEV MOVEMENT 2 n=1 Tax=Juglans microcarpa x Juglans regia TaxID=2249226 RepID=UPI001B7E856F|nr:inactive protein RESTRICTED TEV MOVEMENT 2 [Juglans microcarpa x Juglans regia]